MNCGEVRERIDAFVDEEVTERERAAVESHLDECEACRKLRTHTSLEKNLVRSRMLFPESVRELRSHVRRRLVAEAARLDRRRWMRVAGSVAACLLLVLTVFVVLLQGPPRWTHAKASEGCLESFLRRVAAMPPGETPESETAQKWASRVSAEVLAQTGVEISNLLPALPKGACMEWAFAGWENDTVHGLKAIRIDFTPTAKMAAKLAGTRSANSLLSVFLLPVQKMRMAQSELKLLEEWHGCHECVQSKQGIFCIRRGGFFVGAVSNLPPKVLNPYFRK